MADSTGFANTSRQLFTAYELAANRREARLIGIADAMRELMDGSGYSDALRVLVLTFPGSYQYVPLGSRPGETKPMPQAQIEYREGEVYYHRPGNYGHADSVWSVPR